jgi:hypothetical protein
MSLQSKLQDNTWTYVPPNESQVLMINVFDDGNERFEQYENEWILFGTKNNDLLVLPCAFLPSQCPTVLFTWPIVVFTLIHVQTPIIILPPDAMY